MTEFWKSVTFWQSYRHQLVVHFFGHSVVILNYLLTNGLNHDITHHVLYVNLEALRMSNYSIMTHLTTTTTDTQTNTQNNLLQFGSKSINKVKILYLVKQLQNKGHYYINRSKKTNICYFNSYFTFGLSFMAPTILNAVQQCLCCTMYQWVTSCNVVTTNSLDVRTLRKKASCNALIKLVGWFVPILRPMLHIIEVYSEDITDVTSGPLKHSSVGST